MHTFFSSLSSLEAFASSLNTLNRDSSCQHCSKNDQWVSHGFIRKVRRGRVIDTVVGKRLFCSNRDNKQGCGRTLQLYLAHYIPNMHYSALQVVTFITQLLAHHAVEEAYRDAVGECEARQAWRWINRINANISAFRRRVEPSFSSSIKPIPNRSRRLTLILEPLQQLLRQGCDLILHQANYQENFM